MNKKTEKDSERERETDRQRQRPTLRRITVCDQLSTAVKIRG